MKLPEEAVATAAHLSDAAQKFLYYIASNPEGCRLSTRAIADLPSWVTRYPYPLQTWPTFIGGQALQNVQELTIEVTRLAKRVLERIFNNDSRRIAHFYNVQEDLVALLLTPPDGIEEMIGRCDFMDTRQGLKCLEINAGGFVGGWHLRFWEQIYRKTPAIAEFLQEQGIYPRYQDPLLSLFDHLVRNAIKNGHCRGGIFNTLLVMSSQYLPFGIHAASDLGGLYSSVLRGSGLEGKLLVGSYSRPFTVRQGVLHASGGESVQAVVEYADEPTPHEVYRCFKMGTLGLYNGPLARLLADKRNFALLSEHQDSDVFDSAERATLQKYLPWSRKLVRGKTSYQGEHVDLSALITARKDDFVIKRGVGARGENVLVGRFTAAAEWESHIQKEIENGDWLVQEYVSSRPYLYPTKDGYALHDVVWGTFFFGASYGGGFLRTIPSGKAGVINSARGATEGLFFEA